MACRIQDARDFVHGATWRDPERVQEWAGPAEPYGSAPVASTIGVVAAPRLRNGMDAAASLIAKRRPSLIAAA